MSSESPRPVTYTRAAAFYNESGETFVTACPVCARACCVSRGTEDSLKVECDNGCPPEVAASALSALILSEEAPRSPAQASPSEPDNQSSHAAGEPPAKRGRPRSETSLPGQPLAWTDPDPAPDPVDGATLLKKIASLLTTYVRLPKGAAETLAAWCVATHVHGHPDLDISTYLRITSPTKRCGKSLLLEVVKEFVRRPLAVCGIKEAGIFRTVEACMPTLLLDEVDQTLRANSDLVALVNSSQKRSEAQTIRTVGSGRGMVQRLFSTWCPKLLAGIGRLPDTVADRCITVRMTRRSGPALPKWRTRDRAYIQQLMAEIVRWAADNADAIMQARNALSLPDWLSDRAEDAWAILFAVAHVAGGDWPARMSHACQRIQAAAKALEEHDLLEVLATDLVVLLQGHDKKVYSRTLVDELRAIEDGVWNEYRPRGLTQCSLADMLKQLEGPAPRTVRIGGGSAKGYFVADLLAACRPYAFRQGDEDTTMLRQANGEPANAPDSGETATCDGTADAPVTPNVTLSASNGADCDGVTNEIIVICKTEGDECQHELSPKRGAPDNGEFIPCCKGCGAWSTPAGWLFWNWDLRWHLRCDSRWMKWRYKDSTGSVERDPVEGKVSIPMCPECRRTVQVHGQCLFCTYPRGLTFGHAA